MEPLRRQLTDQKMSRLLKVINLIRQHDSEIPGQVIATFLYVAAHDNGGKGCHKAALEEDLNLSTSSCSRATDWLARKHQLSHKAGMQLIDKTLDPTNRRRVVLSLSRKGQDLVNLIKDELYE